MPCCQSKKWRCEHKCPLKLRAMTWNLYRGFEPNLRVGNSNFFPEVAAEGGQVPTLNSERDVQNNTWRKDFPTPDDVGRASEEQMAQAVQNLWLQIDNSALGAAKKRMDAAAIVIADQKPDLLALQESLVVSNNDKSVLGVGDTNWGPSAGAGGDEDSVEQWRVYDYAKMLQKRLKENHGLEYDIVVEQVADMDGGLRSKEDGNLWKDANINTSIGFNLALLVRRSLCAKVVATSARPYGIGSDQRLLASTLLQGNGTELDNQGNPLKVNMIPTAGGSILKRGYLYADLEIKGRVVRVVNTHLTAGGQPPTVLGQPVPNSPPGTPPNPNEPRPGLVQDNTVKISYGNAARQAKAQELLKNVILPSPHPVLLLGDLNQSNIATQKKLINGPQFQTQAFFTLAGSVDANGQIQDGGGPLVDSLVEVFGPNEDDYAKPEFNTNSFFFTEEELMARNQNVFTKMRQDTATFRFVADHVMARAGDGWQFKSHVLPPPLTPTAEQPFAFPSDHRAVVADVVLH